MGRSCKWSGQVFADGDLRLDFCAECLDNFIRETLGHKPEDGILPLGFTVSFIPSVDEERSYRLVLLPLLVSCPKTMTVTAKSLISQLRIDHGGKPHFPQQSWT
jgi:hypothetical protein